MKALSETQARKCENAKGKRCSCRCRGACHGRALFARDSPRVDFECLTETDPHHLEPKIAKKFMLPERYRNFSPEHAAKTLRHARNYVVKNHGEWARWPGDVEVAADCNELLKVLESKVLLGVDEIRA